ncbi:hypothetical protein D3C87_2024290 [compost metagenome]
MAGPGAPVHLPTRASVEIAATLLPELAGGADQAFRLAWDVLERHRRASWRKSAAHCHGALPGGKSVELHLCVPACLIVAVDHSDGMV